MAHVIDARFTEGSLMRHVSIMSLTSSLGLMAIFAVDLIDVLFISMLGQEALAAAAGYASTVMFFASAINIGLSIAAGALVANSLGAGKDLPAREHAFSAAMFAIAFGILVPLIMLPNLDLILGLIGADGDVAERAKSYLWIILPSTFMSGIGMTVVATLRAYGDARRAMYPSLIGAIVNGALDPLLIFGLSMGLEGAAWATVAARMATMLLALWFAWRVHDAFAVPRTQCFAYDIREGMQIAAPAVLATIATPVGAAIVTREMAKYGTDAVAGMAIISRMIPVVFSVVLALSGAIGPIMGQNFGAGRLDRVRQAFFDGVIFAGFYVVLISGLLFVFRQQIADLFGAQGMTRELIVLFCGPIALASFFNAVIFVANASYNNLGHPSYSTWINWGRQTLGTIPFILVGGALYGAPGVLIGQAAGGVLFAGIATWLSLWMITDQAHPMRQLTCRFQLQRRMHEMYNRTA
ncbi:Multidrug export protein MepA [Roseovarius sp. THAF9]|uniref:MATE family efflux transporter n=1 Tax=Roseovarius sp. THAF9 TaxID=2587847 RepID=UPI0012678C53|nr:MATE family efflux transporter [Roseovarius sp. THAF9]QFT93014.1 Multidrug export protein MepA [Roseovarius sp. THAF9]